MKIFEYVIPILILALIIYAIIKKVNVFQCFVNGAKGSLNTVIQIFPYIVAVIFMTECFKASGINERITDLLGDFLHFLRIDGNLLQLLIIKPVSGSGSLAILSDIIKDYGADSFKARTASVIFGSSETTFYIASVYFCNVKNKKITKGIVISLFCAFFSSVFACFICRFI
ncbi:MAG: nucleoside recognition domain-containing protein [Christensenellaceae bacterium]